MKRSHSILVVLGMITLVQSYSQATLYPIYDQEPVTDKVFDTLLVDEFRDFEDFRHNEDVISYYREQENITEKFFAFRPSTFSIGVYLGKFEVNESETFDNMVFFDEKNVYVLKSKKGNSQKLYLKNTSSGEERLIFDPATYLGKKGETHFITSFKPSWDGKYVAISIKEKGGYTSEIVLHDIVEEKIIKTNIFNSRPNEYYGINWLPNNSGFLFTSLRHLDGNNSSIKQNTSLTLYNLKTNKTTELLGNGIGPVIDKRLYPLTKINAKNDRYIIGYIAGPTQYWESFYQTVDKVDKEKTKWKKLFDLDDKVFEGKVRQHENTIYFLTDRTSEFRSIWKKNMKSGKLEQVVGPIQGEVIQEFEFVNGMIYLITNKNGVESSFYEFDERDLHKIPLPVKGTKASLHISGLENSDVWVNISSPVHPLQNYRYDVETNTLEKNMLYQPQEFPEFADLVYKNVEVESHDGAMVPMTILHRDDIKLNSNNPLLSYSYGAFGYTDDMEYLKQYLAFASLGGVVVFPHIRGGGAKGEKWHQAGMRTRKENSWKDLEACINYMVDKGYSSHEKTTLYADSAGAIAVAMAINKNPKLASMIALSAPVLNPSRKSYVYDSHSFLEYGNPNTKEEAYGLLKMDSYLNIPEKTDFPAILIFHGLNDDRVYLHEPLKYIAQVQKNNVGENPVLLDIDPTAGHFGAWYYNKYSRMFSLALERCGFDFTSLNH